MNMRFRMRMSFLAVIGALLGGDAITSFNPTDRECGVYSLSGGIISAEAIRIKVLHSGSKGDGSEGANHRRQPSADSDADDEGERSEDERKNQRPLKRKNAGYWKKGDDGRTQRVPRRERN
ncbi:conserved hypothetical protein [Neospora caninum Liverpool]|uniref:Uncharacterized protein n=1 Tax=Neospora caninum (strain Liverpool) TaxID=572307 RepID=F0VGE2_NEOCL|nr:conserved hypothetical protein [Neospora caninum Liverpool]CBZ52786.1 conserved hypothetical protein [Neospora caninum Liverpool]CEL66768.1 TPA: hypothetical protein BN1204_025740 [Neospora caninum Liverpool]|eukprot:XP_003882818.1 conserved hypothetical protein [Neospora caninum Liverpool]